MWLCRPREQEPEPVQYKVRECTDICLYLSFFPVFSLFHGSSTQSIIWVAKLTYV